MGWHVWGPIEISETIRLAELFSFEQIAEMKGYRQVYDDVHQRRE